MSLTRLGYKDLCNRGDCHAMCACRGFRFVFLEDVEMSKLLDAVADRLQLASEINAEEGANLHMCHRWKSRNVQSCATRRPRMLKKMPDWSLAALFWSWPKDGSMQGAPWPKITFSSAVNTGSVPQVIRCVRFLGS